MELEKPVYTQEGAEVWDVMKAFKGDDDPAAQFEIGQQKGVCVLTNHFYFQKHILFI